jgi:glycosyltransferase involved in cell wall biosynthesis
MSGYYGMPFAAELIHAMENPSHAQAMAYRARARVLARYDWDVLADALERSWRRCVAPGISEPAHRAVGACL